MNKDSIKGKVFGIFLVLVVLLLIPFKIENVNAFACGIKTYNAVLYTVVQIDANSFSTTKVYPFPSNFEMREKLEALGVVFNDVGDVLDNLAP